MYHIAWRCVATPNPASRSSLVQKKIQELIKLFLIPGGAKNPKSEKKEANMLKEEKRKHKNRDKDKENIDSHKSTEHSEYLIF